MKEPLYRAKCARTGKWMYGSLSNKRVIIPQKGSRILIDKDTIGEYVITHKGKDRFTGDVFFEEVEHDEGDVVLYSVLVWLKDQFCYTLLGLGEYIAYSMGRSLDDEENYTLNPEDFDKLHYKGTIYDKDFQDLCSGPVF